MQRFRNACFTEGHKVTHAGYLEWKASMLKRFGAKLYYDSRPRAGKWNDRVLLATRVSPLFTALREQWYRGGRKAIPSVSAIRLTPLLLAVWVMDDGGLIKRYYGLPHMQLATYGFSVETNHELRELLESYLGPRVTVRSGVGSGGSGHYIGIGVDATKRIADLCAPHWQPSMAYKFPYPEMLAA